jgi:hypothetical protein
MNINNTSIVKNLHVIKKKQKKNKKKKKKTKKYLVMGLNFKNIYSLKSIDCNFISKNKKSL